MVLDPGNVAAQRRALSRFLADDRPALGHDTAIDVFDAIQIGLTTQRAT